MCFIVNKFRAGIQLSKHIYDNEGRDISLEGLQPQVAERKLEEKLEELLAPGSRSIVFTLTITRRTSDAKKQKPNVLCFLETFVSFVLCFVFNPLISDL